MKLTCTESRALPVIARSNLAEASYLDIPSSRLLITFSSFNYRPHDGSFWGDTIAEKLGWSAIGITSLNGRDWFPRAGMLQLIPKVREISERYKTVVAYGGSMGGYAALKYGRAVGANHTVAFAPQFTLDPELEPEKIYNQHYSATLHKDMEISSGDASDNSVIFYDPRHKTDTIRVKHIQAAEPAVSLIPIPYTGHKCILIAAGMDRLLSILDFTTTGRISELVSLGRRLRKDSPVRYSTLAAAAIPRSTDLAEKILSSSRIKIPSKLQAETKYEIAERHFKKGYYDRSLKMAGEASKLQPDDPKYHRQVAKICVKMRLWESAIASLEKVLDLVGNDIPTLVTLAHIFHHLGNRCKAEEFLLSAEKADAHHPRYINGSAQLYAAWGK